MAMLLGKQKNNGARGMNDEQQKNWAKRKSIPTAPEDIRKLGTGKILLYATANAIGQRINTILPKLSLLSAMASTIKMGKNSIAVWHVCVRVCTFSDRIFIFMEHKNT